MQSHRNGKAPANTGSKKKAVSQDKYAAFKKLVIIGASTGGPRSLMQIVPAIPEDIPAAVLIVQHLPPVFTRSLAERLDQVSQIRVVEAEEGSIAGKGRILVAPGDFHMLIGSGGKIKLDQGPHGTGSSPYPGRYGIHGVRDIS